MKRTREETSAPTSLCSDIANYMQRQLGAHHILDLDALLAWHRTCHAFYRDWACASYRDKLLERALALARRRHLSAPCSGLHTARVFVLDCALLACRMGEALVPRCLISPDNCISLNCVLGTRFLKCGVKVRDIANALGDARIQTIGVAQEALPVRLGDAFWRATSYVRQRHGWLVELRRTVTRGSGVGKKTETLDVGRGDEVHFEDELCITLVPETYK